MARSSPLRRVPDVDPNTPSSGFTAEVVELAEGQKVAVRPKGTRSARRMARLARIAGYEPAVGDVLAVVPIGGELVAVAVLEASRPLVLVARDGASARLVDGAIELSDGEGRLLVRYADGTAEVAPVKGDLKLRAPHGRVSIEAGLDVAIASARDVEIRATRSAELRASSGDSEVAPRVRIDAKGATVAGPTVEVRARRARTTAGVLEAIAREMVTKAQRIETSAKHHETHAERVVVVAKDVAHEIADLLETKVGRVRTLVRGVFSLRSRATTMKSKDDTSIDGRRVLLG
jgi:hypothetical protein